MTSIMHNSQQADEELAFVKRQLGALGKDHDSLHLENVNLRAKVEELQTAYDAAHSELVRTTTQLGACRGVAEELTQINSCLGADKNSLLVEGAGLERQLAAMTAERDKVFAELCASQASEAELRDAFGYFTSIYFEERHRRLASAALAAPSDTTALTRACKLYAAQELVLFGLSGSMTPTDCLLDKAAQLRKEAE